MQTRKRGISASAPKDPVGQALAPFKGRAVVATKN